MNNKIEMKMKKNQLTMLVLLRQCWDLPHVVMMTK